MNTLAFHKARPMTSLISLADVPAHKIMTQIPAFIKGHSEVVPEVAALNFYLQNHAWGLVQLRNEDHEPLNGDGEVARKYHEEQHDEIIRMFYYLILICTRESRHVHSNNKKTALFQKYSNLTHYHSHAVNDTTSYSKIKMMCENMPEEVSFGDFTDFLVDAFKCSYSGGYGGAKWRVVAECLREFAHGNISAEMMMDTAFTLAHNNGPIFNKGMLYDHYGHEFMKILDTQASGQIPQMVKGSLEGYAASTEVKKLFGELAEVIGEDFEGPVDWDLVTKNSKGGHSYSHSSAKKVKGSTKPAHKPETITSKLAQKAKEKTHLQVMPGVWVKKLNRKEIAA